MMSKVKAVRRIDGKISSMELLEELMNREVSGYYKLGRESRAIIQRLDPAELIIAARAEIDIKSPYARLSERIPDASRKAIEEIVLALIHADFVLDESRKCLYIRKFLAEELFGDLYGSVAEYEKRVPYSRERIDVFYSILRDVLSDAEYSIVVDKVHGLFDVDDYEDAERAKWLYDLAIHKLKGECCEVNCLIKTKEADLYLASDRDRLITDREFLVYRNAYKDLRRVYCVKNKPYRVCPWRLK